MPFRPPPTRTILFLTLSTVTLTLLQTLEPPLNDPLTQSLKTENFSFSSTTYHNRHANRCVTIRCGSPDTPRTPHETICDTLYLTITTTHKNVSHALCAVDYIASHWDAISRTYNDGIVYISNDVVITNPPLGGRTVHSSIDSSGAPTWFSLSKGASVGVLRQWIRQGRLSCDNSGLACHPRVVSYSCDGARDPRGCRQRPWGAAALKAFVISVSVWVAITRMRSMGRVIMGRTVTGGSVPMTPIFCTVLVGVVGFAGMGVKDMAWLVARVVGVRLTHEFGTSEIEAGDVYRTAAVRGVYRGYAYVWSDGEELVRVSGPGVGVVVGAVSMGLFVKRALLDGLLVRCCVGIVAVFFGCALVERALKRNRKVQQDDDEYLPVDVARRIAKRGSKSSTRVFVRDRDRVNIRR